MHVQGVAARAGNLASVLGADADLLEAAAWLHDIGYAPGLAVTGLHALDGARYRARSDVADRLPQFPGWPVFGDESFGLGVLQGDAQRDLGEQAAELAGLASRAASFNVTCRSVAETAG